MAEDGNFNNVSVVDVEVRDVVWDGLAEISV
jgi:hypothetical protein